MRKIFGIGLSRSGTTTCYELVQRWGISAVHLPLSPHEIDQHRFANDVTVSARFETLDRRYPQSKFIYTVRDMEAWVTSCLRWLQFAGRDRWYAELPDDAARQWIDDADRRIYGRDYAALASITADELRAAYVRHDQRVRRYFRDRPDDLLVLDITDRTSQPLTRLMAFLERRQFISAETHNASAWTPTSEEAADAAQCERLLRLALTWKQLGKIPNAIKCYRDILEIDPANLSANLQLAALFAEQNQLNQAIDVLWHSMSKHAGEGRLHKALIDLLVTKHANLDAAFAHYQLRPVAEKMGAIGDDDILCCVAVRNERARLPAFLQHYRQLGVDRFLVVDNGSEDGTLAYLRTQPDVLLWQSTLSFNRANHGSAWFELLLRRVGVGHWCLTVDADELLVYQGYQHRPLSDLCAELDQRGKTAFTALLLDMYANKPVVATHYSEGERFLDVCPYFDADFYHTKRASSGPFHNQTMYLGGVRQRVFNSPRPFLLNKVPLFRYSADTILFSGQHWLNHPIEQFSQETGCLLHFKFFSTLAKQAHDEARRKEHYDNAIQYQQYAREFETNRALTLYDKHHSVKYRDVQQLIEQGIIEGKQGST